MDVSKHKKNAAILKTAMMLVFQYSKDCKSGELCPNDFEILIEIQSSLISELNKVKQYGHTTHSDSGMVGGATQD